MGVSLQIAIRDYCQTTLVVNNRSGKTRKAYHIDLCQFAAFADESTALSNVAPETIESWLVHLQQHGYKVSSIRRKMATIRVFFNHLKARGHIDESPCQHICLRLGAPKLLTRTIDGVDLARLVNAVELHATVNSCEDPQLYRLRDRLIIRLLGCTGIRVGELVSLSLGDWSASSQSFRINGKGGRERTTLIVRDEDVQCVSEYLHERIFLSVNHNGLFVNQRGSQLTTEGVRAIIRRIARSMNIRAHITPHMFRHTAATRLLESGANLRVVQEFLGHRSIRSTERYTHVSPQYLRETLKKHHPLERLAA
ncbi:tyrosine-type recombinase/integrase [Planctomycetales bacterium ZRK34]|nr:tyrosine-type recombinase/integrase [Planctomycetales bacterium ZRK34]